MPARLTATFVLCLASSVFAQAPQGDRLPDTAPLELTEPLDVVMVKGINSFAEQEIALSRERRAGHWNRDYSSREAYEKSVAANRERLKAYIGAVDQRTANPNLAMEELIGGDSGLTESLLSTGAAYNHATVLPGVTIDFITKFDNGSSVIVIPDAAWSPEAAAGLLPDETAAPSLARALEKREYNCLIPRLVSRSDQFSGHPEIRFTNQPHREFLYRPAFELGRHIIGYEVQKILTLVDVVRSMEASDAAIVVWGVGEGGLLALYAAAIDPRIDVCVVSGYFGERENVWKEPIYRNVWRGLAEFGDADIASLIAPRTLIIEACDVPSVTGPPAPRDGRSGAAPGAISAVPIESVEREFERAREHYQKLGAEDRIQLVKSAEGTGPWATDEAVSAMAKAAPAGVGAQEAVRQRKPRPPLSAEEIQLVQDLQLSRQKDQIEELRQYTQRLLHVSDKARDKVWAKADRSSLEAWEKSQESYRDLVYDELIGRIPYELIAANPRSRKVLDEPTHVGYEVTLDVFKAQGLHPLGVSNEPIIAGGILLVPKDLKPGEKRPCVVCQHGLEGTPMDTIAADPNHPGYGPYKGFSTQLVQRGFIVYAPQNPYRGQDEFRVIQRKSNPLGRSLFSYIIPQHQQTLNWLATLPYVDADRIGFYGLSYGGKTAVRVPPMLPPRAPGAHASGSGAHASGSGAHASGAGAHTSGSGVGYCLSICSADFNEWVLKNATTEDRYSYVFTGEYEIFEWNMGHVANYAELSYLMTPRPFMVERGHDDGVAPDEWVAWEFAKVKRHYDKLGIGDRTEMEVFNGPHTINGQGTFDFLHKHLDWPKPK